MDQAMLDYAEKQAQQLAAFRLANMEDLNKRAHTLVTFLFAAATGAGAFAVGLIEKGVLPLAALTLVAACGWYWVAARAVKECLRTRDVAPPGEEPKSVIGLFEQGGKLEQVRHGALLSLHDRQLEWCTRNVDVALALDRAYLNAVALIPCVAGAVALLCALVLVWRG